jgi:hypothetical protein
MKNGFMNKAVFQMVLATGIVGSAAFQAAATVTTSSEVWVGTTSTVHGNGGSGSKVSMFAQRMIRPLATAGVASGVQSAVLVDTNSTWVDSQFGTKGIPSYVEFDNGWMADIADCSAANHCLNLAGSLGGAAATGSKYRVRQHFTVSSMFGTNNEVGLKSGLNPTSADNILVEIPQTQQVVTIFYYDDGTYHGWLDATFAPADNRIIYPEQGVMVRRRLATDANVYLAGPVKLGTSVVTIDIGNNLVGTLKSATSLTLPALNLYTGDSTTGFASGLNPTTSDNFLVVRADGSSSTYFFYNDGTYHGWLDAAFNPADSAQIAPGSAFFIRRKASPAFNWTIPAE